MPIVTASAARPAVDRVIYDVFTPGANMAAPDTLTALKWYKTPSTGLPPFDALNLTDRANPTVISAGTYAVMATINCATKVAGKGAWIALYLDATTYGGYQTAIMPLDGTADNGPQAALGVTWYCPAGAVVNAVVVHDAAISLDFWVEGIVQRLSGPAA